MSLPNKDRILKVEIQELSCYHVPGDPLFERI